jgi:site-specific recombinase XerD
MTADRQIVPAGDTGLAVRAIELAKRAQSDATINAYISDFKQYQEWCEGKNLVALPSLPDQVALYITHLHTDLHRAPATIRRALTAIRRMHRSADHEVPVNDFVRSVERGIRRSAGTAQKQSTPITLARLERIIGSTPTDLLGRRDRALLLIGWSGALRRSELVALDVADIDDADEGIVLRLRRSKTDQEGRGRSVPIPFVAESKLCAVRALRKWLSLSRIDSGPVFRPVGPAGLDKWFTVTSEKRLSGRSVSLVVKRRAKDAGYDPILYSGHSLRSGFATAAAHIGVRDRDIRRITGHRSAAQLDTYIREGKAFHNHPLYAMLGSAGQPIGGESV